MARRIVGLDLGAYSIKAYRIEPQKKNERFKVLDVKCVVLPREDESLKSLSDRQAQALKELLASGILEGDSFFSHVPSAYANMRNLEVPFADPSKIEAILPGILDNEIPFELSNYISSWHIKDEKNIRISFAKKNIIAEKLSILQSVMVDPKILSAPPMVYYELIREYGKEAFWQAASLEGASFNSLGLIVDFGHTSTNILIFDDNGLVLSKVILLGSSKITEDIAKELNIDFYEAQNIKHEYKNDNEKIKSIIEKYLYEIYEEIRRIHISLKLKEQGEIKAACFFGGGSKLFGLREYFEEQFLKDSINLIRFAELEEENLALAKSLAILGLHLNSKDNRFNFRKGEFAFRGGFDFLRINLSAFFLWGLTIFCACSTLWFSFSSILDKENKVLENSLSEICKNILGQKNLSSTKCLNTMKEQISANIDLGVPEYTASNVYIDLAQHIPKSMNVTLLELDVQDNKVRIKGEIGTFEDVDKLLVEVAKIPCLVKMEKGGKMQVKPKGVEFMLTGEIDCSGKKNEILGKAK